MPKLRIFGRVFPENVKIDFFSASYDTYNEPLDLDLKMLPRFEGNKVIVNCELNQFEPQKHFLALYIQAHDLVRSILDLITFSRGVSLTLIMEKIEHHDGTIGDIRFEDDSVTPFATSVANERGFGNALSLVFHNPEIQLALRDLAESLAHLYSAPINCARVVETIRNQFVPEGVDRKHGWKPMQEALNVSEKFLRAITDLSRNPRHGKQRRIMGDPIRFVGYGAWQVMNRYFEYKVRGSKPLTAPDFPLID